MTDERQPDEVLTKRAREWLAQLYPGRGYEQLRKNSPDLLAAFAQSIQAEAAQETARAQLWIDTTEQQRKRAESAEQQLAEAHQEQAKSELTHTRSCPLAWRNSEEPCTCGLEHRIHLQTEQEMHAAWRKRAEESEQQLAEARAQTEELLREVECQLGLVAEVRSWVRVRAAYEKLRQAQKAPDVASGAASSELKP